MLGSSELRAQTTAHGAELASLGQRHALRLGRPRLMLAWSERWRAIALAVPPVRPPGDERVAGRPRGDARRQQQAVPGQQPGTAHCLAQPRAAATGAGGPRQGPADPGHRPAQRRASSIAGFDVPGLLAELGDDRLLELVDIEGELHVLVCGSGKVRRFAAGTAEQAARDVRFARFMLRRLAYGPLRAAAHGESAIG